MLSRCSVRHGSENNNHNSPNNITKINSNCTRLLVHVLQRRDEAEVRLHPAREDVLNHADVGRVQVTLDPVPALLDGVPSQDVGFIITNVHARVKESSWVHQSHSLHLPNSNPRLQRNHFTQNNFTLLRTTQPDKNTQKQTSSPCRPACTGTRPRASPPAAARVL